MTKLKSEDHEDTNGVELDSDAAKLTGCKPGG